MMLTTPESVAEARRALQDFMRRERDGSQLHRINPGATFRTEGDSDTDFDNADNLGRIQREARESARRYIESRSKNIRPGRQVDETNPAAIKGYIQALSWLKHRGKSRPKCDTHGGDAISIVTV